MIGGNHTGIIQDTGIISPEELSEVIKEISISNFQPNIIRKRISQYINNNRISSVDLKNIFARISSETAIYLYPGETQIFRDISFWKYLLDNPGIAFSGDEGNRILFFDCPTGEEFYSWEIMRQQYFPEVKIRTKITTQLKSAASIIQRRQMSFKKISTLHALLQHFEREINIMEYLEQKYNTWFACISPNPEPEISVCDCLTPFPSNSFSVIFCRNRLIYYREPACKIIISNLFRAIIPGGFFISGTHENFELIKAAGFIPVNTSCAIFRKPE